MLIWLAELFIYSHKWCLKYFVVPSVVYRKTYMNINEWMNESKARDIEYIKYCQNIGKKT